MPVFSDVRIDTDSRYAATISKRTEAKDERCQRSYPLEAFREISQPATQTDRATSDSLLKPLLSIESPERGNTEQRRNYEKSIIKTFKDTYEDFSPEIKCNKHGLFIIRV